MCFILDVLKMIFYSSISPLSCFFVPIYIWHSSEIFFILTIINKQI